MNKLYIPIILVLFLQIASFAQVLPEFSKINEIKLLKSNRDDVRKIFSNYELIKSSDPEHFDQFSTYNVKIEVLYSDGKCDENLLDFEVSEWKVLSIHLISTNGKFTQSKLGVNLQSSKTISSWNQDAVNEDLGIVASLSEEMIEQLYFVPTKNSFSSLCPNKSTPLPSTIRFYFSQLKKQRKYLLNREIADVKDLVIDKNELQKSCEAKEKDETFTKYAQIVRVSTKENNPNRDHLTFNYTVSGGKIIGQGSEVLWDLSGVKAGDNTITAAIDDGCGFCGRTKTKTVTVKEPQNCN